MLSTPRPQFAPAVGSYLLATLLAGRMYDSAAAAHGNPRACVGPDCFGGAFRALAALAAGSGAAYALVTARRSEATYRRIARHMRAVRGARGWAGRGWDVFPGRLRSCCLPT